VAAAAFVSSIKTGNLVGGTRLALARQRRTSEADNLEVGDVGRLGTVGRPEEAPFLVVRLLALARQTSTLNFAETRRQRRSGGNYSRVID
jgi:hypothetical protein